MNNLTVKQKEILNVAIDLFSEKGFADTSMRDIAEVINVKAASLYSHIKSKEEILEWISDDVKSRFMKNIPEILLDKYSSEEKFRLMLRNHLNSIYHNVKLYDVFFTNIFRLRVDFKNQSKYVDAIDNYILFAESVIKNYLISLGLKEDEDLVLATKFSVHVLNSIYRYIPKEHFDLEKHAEFLKNMLLYGVIGK